MTDLTQVGGWRRDDFLWYIYCTFIDVVGIEDGGIAS
jgi:hypothetical protein